MKRKRFKDEQIVAILKEGESSEASVKEVCRKHGISEYTFYRWRKKYQGLTISEAKRYRQVEKENERLKKLLANRDLEIEGLQEILQKNGLRHSGGGMR